LAAVLLLALAGCGVEVVPREAPEPPLPSLPAPSTSAPTAVFVPSPGVEAEAQRGYYLSRVTVRQDCAAGEVVIDAEDEVVQVTADCPRVVLRGADTTVLAEGVGTLQVDQSAGSSYVFLRRATTINVDADFMTVYWDDGNPGVKVTGFDSTANPNPLKER
jgi:hypothetical protein